MFMEIDNLINTACYSAVISKIQEKKIKNCKFMSTGKPLRIHPCNDLAESIIKCLKTNLLF